MNSGGNFFYLLGTSQPIRSDFTEITLTIEARDSGSPVMTAVATITILISDLNDNAPRFEFSSYSVNVDEDFSTSKSIFIVVSYLDVEITAIMYTKN